MLHEKITECLIEIGITAASNRFQKKIEERILRSRLKNYIEKHRKYNYLCSLSEEIDFEGLAVYIINNLQDDISTRLFCANVKERKQARNAVVENAIAYSKAETEQAKRRVKNITETALDILRNFYKKKINLKDCIIAEEIVDAINDHIDDKLVEYQCNTISYSPETFLQLSRQGDFTTIKNKQELIKLAIDNGHPLFPYYGYDSNQHSVPKLPEAVKKFPPHFEGMGTIKMGGEIIKSFSPAILNYADRHQLTLELTVSEVTKYLGDYKDPNQEEAQELIGKTIVRRPNAFPSSIPCRLVGDSQTIIEYIELRIVEILDDGMYILSNGEQENTYVDIKIAFDPTGNSKQSTYAITPRNNLSNKNRLKYLQSERGLSGAQRLSVYSLQHGEVIIAGPINQTNDQSILQDLDERIDFYSRICDIEKYINKEITLSEEISDQEFSMVVYLSDLIRGEKHEQPWNSVKLPCVIDQDFRNRIDNLEKELYGLALICTATISIFNEEIQIPLLRELNEAELQDYSKLKEKVEKCDDGDTINVTLIATGKKVFCDSMCPDSILKEAEHV